MTETDFYGGGDFADYEQDPAAGYEDPAGYEGDFAGYEESPGLPEGHWAHDTDWVNFANDLFSTLLSNPEMFESFQGWLESAEGEPAEQKFESLADPALRDVAKGYVTRFHEERARGR